MKDIVDSCSKPAWKWNQKEKENVRKGNRNITAVVMSRFFFYCLAAKKTYSALLLSILPLKNLVIAHLLASHIS